MKKIIINSIFIFVLVLSACTKKYACKCTTTLSQDGYYPKKTETIEDIKGHVSKKKGTKICDNTAKQMQANTSQIWPSYVTVTTNCLLKDY